MHSYGCLNDLIKLGDIGVETNRISNDFHSKYFNRMVILKVQIENVVNNNYKRTF